jgi:hypothetical protein
MNEAKLRSYLDGWALTCNSTPASVEAMIAGAHPDIRFSDVNSPNVHRGYDGIRYICGLATQKYTDAAVTWRDLLFDGTNWSIRWTFSVTLPDGKTHACPGASAGRVAEDGRVIEQTDYWNRASLEWEV